MKILVSCQNMNAYGGSELYHYELLIGLSQYKDLDITFATYTIPNLDFHLYKDLINKGIKVKEISTDLDPYFDLIIVSQPHPTSLLCHYYPNVPKISIIHSALRSEDAIKHESIKHYISVQPDIYRCLKNQYGIKTKDISMIYNPIDENRFRPFKIPNGYSGLLIGELNDSLRIPMIEHITNIIEPHMDLVIVSKSKREFYTPRIKIVDALYNTELLLKRADFTVGLGGRTTIEGWMCGIPSYIYKVDPQGRILDVQLKYPPKMDRFKRSVVSEQHYKLYNKIINGI